MLEDFPTRQVHTTLLGPGCSPAPLEFPTGRHSVAAGKCLCATWFNLKSRITHTGFNYRPNSTQFTARREERKDHIRYSHNGQEFSIKFISEPISKFICLFVFDTRFLCVALLASNSQRSTSLCLLNAGIKDVHHQAQSKFCSWWKWKVQLLREGKFLMNVYAKDFIQRFSFALFPNIFLCSPYLVTTLHPRELLYRKQYRKCHL